MSAADRRKSYKKAGKTLSLVDIIQKDSEDPGENQQMNRSDLLHKLAIQRTTTMKKREETAPKDKKGLGSSRTISNLLASSKTQKAADGGGYGSDEFIDYDQKFGPKRKRVTKNKRD